MDFYHYSQLKEPIKYGAVCALEEAGQYKMDIKRSSLIMTPGIHPDIPQDSSESGGETKE